MSQNIAARFLRSLQTRGVVPTLRSTRRSLERRLGFESAPYAKGNAPLCESIAAWAAEYPGAHVVEILPPQTLIRQLPQTIEPNVRSEFTNAQHKKVPAKYLARLPQAQLVGRDGLLALPTGEYALEWAFARDLIERHRDYKTAPASHVERKRGNFYSLLWVHWQNYFHWLHDSMMRLYGVLDRLPADTRFIIPAQLSPAATAALDCFGIPQAQRLHFDGQTTWQVETLHFASHTKRSSYDLPEEVKWFRQRIWQGCGIRGGAHQKRIYVSRRRAKWRRVVNEVEVQQYLAAHGFEVFELEHLSFREQVALFSQAEIIVASHGAGNANLMFAPPHARVVEIFSPNYVVNVYWAICSALGIEYWYLIAEGIPTKQGPSFEDIRVPLEQLQKIILPLLARAEHM
jgi:hypothetical protein